MLLLPIVPSALAEWASLELALRLPGGPAVRGRLGIVEYRICYRRENVILWGKRERASGAKHNRVGFSYLIALGRNQISRFRFML